MKRIRLHRMSAEVMVDDEVVYLVGAFDWTLDSVGNVVTYYAFFNTQARLRLHDIVMRSQDNAPVYHKGGVR